MLQSIGKPVNYPDGNYVIQKFRCIVVLIGRNYIFRSQYHSRQLAAPYFYVMLVKSCFQLRQEILRNVTVNKTAFNCIAYRRTLSFSVVHNIHRHIDGSCRININMAVSRTRFNYRNGGVLYHSLDKLCSASGDKHIDISVCLHHLSCYGSVCILHKLNNIGRKTCGLNRLTHQVAEHFIGIERLLASSEDHGVSAFKAQCGGVHRNVWPCLVNYSHNPHRNTDLCYPHSVWSHRSAYNLPHRVIERGKLFTGAGYALDSLFVKPQPVLKRRRHIAADGVFKVQLVGLYDLRHTSSQNMRDLKQRVVLLSCGGVCKLAFAGFCLNAQFFNVIHNIFSFGNY